MQLSDDQLLDVVVIGAGPSGLILGRLFSEAVCNFRIFDKNEDVGGIWDVNAFESPMYESCHMISSKSLSGFKNFPIPESYPDYLKHNQFLKYLQSFADFYCLRDFISFESNVVRADRDENSGIWTLEVEARKVTRIVFSKYLVVCTGRNQIPNSVNFMGKDSFEGEVRHSKTYKSMSEFNNRKVLIVGGGNSGVDIACDASIAADKAIISLRRGYHFIPKYIFGQPADAFNKNSPPLPEFVKIPIYNLILRMINGDTTRFGLEKPDHGLLEASPLVNNQLLHYLGHGDCTVKPGIFRLDGKFVEFIDGSREEVDLIITATGYKNFVPFINPEIQDRLYLEVFSRSVDNIAFLNFVTPPHGSFNHFQEIGELIVADCLSSKDSKVKRRFSELKKRNHPRLSGGRNWISSERHKNVVDVKVYMNEINKVKKSLGI